LIGVRAGSAPAEEAVDAGVAAVPGRAGRRVLGSGSALVGPMLKTTRPGRLETAVSVLALASSAGVTRETFWEATYGFAFDAPIHGAALDALVHRLREVIGDAAAVDRREGLFVLDVKLPFVVPDPRCTRSLDDELLRVLARAGKGSAKDAAASLGVPLRTVQLRLKRLAEDGACTVEKHGRNVEYRVEDTTFHEPTRH
jgi:hypothetical protein